MSVSTVTPTVPTSPVEMLDRVERDLIDAATWLGDVPRAVDEGPDLTYAESLELLGRHAKLPWWMKWVEEELEKSRVALINTCHLAEEYEEFKREEARR